MTIETSRRVLLLNPPSNRLVARDKYCTSVSKATYYWPQVDLLALSGRLAMVHHLGVIDAVAQKLDDDACFRRIRQHGYDTVIFLTSAASWQTDFAFAERLKSQLGVATIANGGFLLFQSERALRQLAYLDAVLLDFTSADIMQYLSGDLGRVRHLTFRDGTDIVAGTYPGEGAFSYPAPRHDRFPLKRYWFPLSRHRTFTAALTSMGCPYDCSFCVPGAWGYRIREVGNVIEELTSVRKHGIREVLFQDPCFGAHREQADELLDAMIEADEGIEWLCQTRVNLVDGARLDRMQRAGCHTIQFGVESGDQRVLDATGKGIGLDEVRRVFARCHDRGIRTNAFYIIGLPGDDVQSIRATIELAVELDSDFATFALPMPQIGTRLGAAALGEKAEQELFPTMDDVSPPSFTNTALTSRELWRWQTRAYRRFYFRPTYLAKRTTRLASAREIYTLARAALSLVLDR